MEKRTILAFVLSMLVLIGWSALFAPQPQPLQDKEKSSQNRPVSSHETVNTQDLGKTSHVPAEVVPSLTEKALLPSEQIEERQIKVDTPLYTAVLSNRGPGFVSFKLKKYHETADPGSPNVELVHLKQDKWKYLITRFNPSTSGGVKYDSLLYRLENRHDITLEYGDKPKAVVFVSPGPGGVERRQTFLFYPDSYSIDLKVEVFNNTKTLINGNLVTYFKRRSLKKSSYYSHIGFVLLNNDNLEEVTLKKPGIEKRFEGNIEWCAYEDTYFISAVIPGIPSKRFVRIKRLSSDISEAWFFCQDFPIAPSSQVASSYTLYLGPRDISTMSSLGKKLERAVNFGWTDIIAKPLLAFLRMINGYVHNYGVSIILLTVFIKIIFWPLTRKSYESMKEMQKLQPRMAKIREKYKDDREKMNREIMALYKTYKVNPMGGCLPMIIQLPVFFALYKILGCAIELRHAPFMLWITDLSAPDRLFHFSFSIPFMTPPYGIPVLTILMGVSMFIQQKMTPTAGDPAQAKIMLMLPIVFTVMFINFPSGLVLYWLVNNIISIFQQYIIQKRAA